MASLAHAVRKPCTGKGAEREGVRDRGEGERERGGVRVGEGEGLCRCRF